MSELECHDDIALYAGDDWTISGTLKNATFEWVLLDQDGNAVAAVSENAVIAGVEPPTDGKITISLSDVATAGLPPGAHVDCLRRARQCRQAQHVVERQDHGQRRPVRLGRGAIFYQ